LIIPRVLPCGFWGNNGNAFFLMFPGPFGPQSSEFMKLSGSASVLSLCCPATAPILWAFQYAAILGHIISHRVPAVHFYGTQAYPGQIILLIGICFVRSDCAEGAGPVPISAVPRMHYLEPSMKPSALRFLRN
jgi:hypothetical protein